MNILYICDEYPPGLNGGIGSITQVLGRELVRQGHNVYVAGLYSYQYGGSDYEEDQGVKVWRLRYGFRLPDIPKAYGLQRRLPDAVKRLLYGRRDFKKFTDFITRLIQEHDIDIIEQPDWITFGYEIGLDRPVLPAYNIPLVIKFHGSHSYSCHELGTTPDRHKASVDQAIFERGDALVAVSRHNAQVNRKLFGGNQEIAVLYNSIEVPQTIPTEKRQADTVFFSGSLIRTKGAFSLMKAWNIVSAQRPELKLLIFGNGKIPVMQELLTPAALNTVIFKGHQPRNTLLDTLLTATVAVYPSYTEAFSLAPLESMSRGCATIFTTRSSGPEVITPMKTGLLADPDQVADIAAKILLLIDNPGLREKIAENGRLEIMTRFNIHKSVADHLSFYRSVIASFKQSRR